MVFKRTSLLYALLFLTTLSFAQKGLLLKDFASVSIYKTPTTAVTKAKFPTIYQTTFRILETEDEHFYSNDLFGYHWTLNGLGLSNTILKKLYYENAKKIRNYE